LYLVSPLITFYTVLCGITTNLPCRRLQNPTTTNNNFDSEKKWLKEEEEKHSGCRYDAHTSVSTSRILFLGQNEFA